MKIYTRRGDHGLTDLFGGPRVSKDHLRVDAYGAVDELNACLGVAGAASSHEDIRALVERAQATLFELGSYLAAPDDERRQKSQIPEPREGEVQQLEQAIDRFEHELEPLRRFILPGGTPAAAAFHHARTVCRRAERRVVTLHLEERLAEPALQFLNRLSDLLFTLARVENKRAGKRETEWIGRER